MKNVIITKKAKEKKKLCKSIADTTALAEASLTSNFDYLIEKYI